MAETPRPATNPAPSVPGTRLPTAVEQATQEAYNTTEREPMGEDQFMPTCMVWATFLGLGLLIGFMLLWVVGYLAGG